MFRIALKGLFARKLRLLLTSSAIVFGVSIAVASFVLTDGLRATFGTLSTDVNKGNDFVVRQKVDFGDRGDNLRVPADLARLIRDLDGVDQVEGQIFVDGAAVPIDGKGKVVKTIGPPLAATNWGQADRLTNWVLVDGRRPVGPTEFALSASTADDYDFSIGNEYTLITSRGQQRAKLVGLAQFTAKKDASVGAVFVLFDNASTQTITGMPGQYQEIWVSDSPGADRAAVQAEISALLPADVEVITNELATKEFADSFNVFIGPIGTILQVFAFIIVFVSAFLINNTFNIIIGQRIRELGLLRALGATGTQVRRSVLTESLLIGALSTLVSLGLGVLFAIGMRAAFAAAGFSLPDGPLELKPRTIIAAIVVGVGVTVSASVLPAFKAARIAPIAALREDGVLTSSGTAARTTAGVIALFVGVALAGIGLFGSVGSTAFTLTLIGGGALVIFVAVAVLSPLIARPAARALGAPLPRILGASGKLARENSARSPRRTAATASALMIGIALVCMVAVVAQSLRTTLKSVLSTGVTADYVVVAERRGPGSGFSPQLARDLTKVPSVSDVVAIRQGQIRIDGDTKSMSAASFDSLERAFEMRVKAGSFKNAPPNGIAIHTDAAKKTGAKVGDTINVEFQGAQQQPFTVVAVFSNNQIFGSNYLIDLGAWNANLPESRDAFVAVRLIDGSDAEASRPALEAVVSEYPPQKLQNKEEFRKTIERNLNNFLLIVNGFLFLSVLVALIGIINTLTLSIFERTRELGLLRAIGMDRRQLRRMIRWEAVVIALFGGILGAVMGIAFGVALASAIPDSIISEIAIPTRQIVFFVVLSGVAGLFAAIFPARRAAKLNVLDAISHS